MEEMLNVREAEVVSLRNYRKKVQPAIIDLKLLLKSMSKIPNLTTREKYAINTLYEASDEGM